MEITKWETIGIYKNEDLKIFQANWLKRKNPKTNQINNFVRLDSPDWVNIIPITSDNHVVMIEQYRHGIDDITLEIPGGLIDKSEQPFEAGMRECIEETGYASDDHPILLGINNPNPAFLNNKCYSYLWINVKKRFEQKLDSNEIINIKLIPLNEIRLLIKSGKINHSLVLNAFFFLFLMKDNI
ncbi:MAG: NUDIX hydrolase [Candidatus Kapaibacteriales bacterium]